MIVFLDIKTFDISLNSTQLFGSGLKSQTSSFTASNWSKEKKLKAINLKNNSTGNNNNNYYNNNNLINKINTE
jgi:hypothetical protein